MYLSIIKNFNILITPMETSTSVIWKKPAQNGHDWVRVSEQSFKCLEKRYNNREVTDNENDIPTHGYMLWINNMYQGNVFDLYFMGNCQGTFMRSSN